MAATGALLSNEEADAAMVMTLAARVERLAFDRRRATRAPVLADGGLQAGGDGIDVTILDLSETGFRAIVPRELSIGSWVRLSLQHDGLIAPEARVKWRRGAEHGFSFAFPLYAEFVAAALSDAAIGAVPSSMLPDVPDVAMSWIDYQARRCRFGDRMVALTPLMTEIMSVLLVRRGEAVTGAELARAIWPQETIGSNRMATLHVIIVRLRDRLPGLLVSPSRGSYMIPLPAIANAG